jgi:sigma-B regulation protein RsbU (phosphoserine phosphatase)
VDTALSQRLQKGLEEKRHNLTGWLAETPETEKAVHLGPSGETGIKDHLGVIDTALQKAEEGTLGLCEVCHDCIDPALLEMDYTVAVCLEHFTEQERRQLETELELSHAVQRALLPQQPPAIPGLDLAAFNRPAQIVGGDYYDFFQFQDGAHGLAIADVEGHGISAGMLMTSLQTSLRTLVPENISPAEVLKRVNKFYLHNINLTTFVTVFLGCFDAGRKELIYSNAGHNPPLLVRGGSGEVVRLSPTGAAIGLVEDYALSARNISLFPGDLLLLYTDGVTEATNGSGEQFGLERMEALARANAHLPASELLQLVRLALNDFVAGQPLADDVTIVTCRIEN